MSVFGYYLHDVASSLNAFHVWQLRHKLLMYSLCSLLIVSKVVFFFLLLFYCVVLNWQLLLLSAEKLFRLLLNFRILFYICNCNQALGKIGVHFFLLQVLISGNGQVTRKMDQNCTIWKEVIQIKYFQRERGNVNCWVQQSSFKWLNMTRWLYYLEIWC